MKKLFKSLILSFFIISFNYTMIQDFQKNTEQNFALKDKLVDFLEIKISELQSFINEAEKVLESDSIEDLIILIGENINIDEVFNQIVQDTEYNKDDISKIIKNRENNLVIKEILEDFLTKKLIDPKKLIIKAAEEALRKPIINIKDLLMVIINPEYKLDINNLREKVAEDRDLLDRLIKSLEKKEDKEQGENIDKNLLIQALKKNLKNRLKDKNVEIISIIETLRSKKSIKDLVETIVNQGITLDELVIEIAQDNKWDKNLLIELIKCSIENKEQDKNSLLKLKPLLRNFLSTKLINKGAIAKSFLDALDSKNSIGDLISEIMQTGINADELSSQIAKELEGDEDTKEAICQLLKCFHVGKKESAIEKILNKFPKDNINKVKNILIGGAIASTAWAFGHAIDHNIMELVEPKNPASALMLGTCALISTVVLYNSDRLLSLLRNQTINVAANGLNKIIDLEREVNLMVQNASDKLTYIVPDFITKQKIVKGVEKDNKYDNFMQSLSKEQKILLEKLLKEKFANFQIDIIFKLCKACPKIILGLDGFVATLTPEQLNIFADLIPESKE